MRTGSPYMKIVIISDIHGNFDALSALPEVYDELWVLGDLVNYGPDPTAVVDFVRSKAAAAVCGNHDYSIGFNQDPRCSPRFREMAEATRRYTNTVLSFGDKHFLRHLPPFVETVRKGTKFHICHAIPSDPLFGYCQAESPRWPWTPRTRPAIAFTWERPEAGFGWRTMRVPPAPLPLRSRRSQIA